MKRFNSSFFSFATLGMLLALFITSQNHQDPVARIGTLTGGKIAATTFQGFKGLNATNGTEACTVISYEMVFVAKKQDPIMSMNREASFNKKSLELVAKAKSLDCYYFDNVMVKCPGDTEERKVNSLVFKIN